MASEIRVDKINSLSGVGTVTLSPTGVDIAGITTAATLKATTGIVTTLTAGSLITSSAVGVGTTNPSAKLETFQEGTRSAGYLFMARAGLDVGRRGYGLYPPSTNSADAPFVWNTGNSHSFEVDNTERLRIHHSGKIGIGTDNPAADLHISSGANTEIRIADTTTTPSFARIIYNNDADNADALVFEVDGGNAISGSNIRFKADGNELARITGIGSFGIGITSPKTDLDIANDAGGTLTLSCSDDSSSADQLIGKINFHTADPSGDGPQNNAIISAHSVESTGSGAYLKFSTAQGGTGSEGADAVERLRITSGGIVQIGGALANGTTDLDTSNSKLTIKQSANNQEDGIYIERSGERRGFYFYVGGALSQSDAFGIASQQLGTKTDVVSIDRGGDVVIGSGNLVIGTAGKGIDFSATADNAGGITSELLDYYEEGTFTFTNQSSDTVSLTANSQAYYTRIGRVVHCQLDVTFSVSGSPSAYVTLNIPYTILGRFGGAVGWTDLGRPAFFYGSGTVLYLMDNNSTSTAKHIYNNEANGKRFIGSFTFITS